MPSTVGTAVPVPWYHGTSLYRSSCCGGRDTGCTVETEQKQYLIQASSNNVVRTRESAALRALAPPRPLPPACARRQRRGGVLRPTSDQRGSSLPGALRLEAPAPGPPPRYRTHAAAAATRPRGRRCVGGRAARGAVDLARDRSTPRGLDVVRRGDRRRVDQTTSGCGAARCGA